MSSKAVIQIMLSAGLTVSAAVQADRSAVSGQFTPGDTRAPSQAGFGPPCDAMPPTHVIGPMSADKGGTYEIRDAGILISQDAWIFFYDDEPDLDNLEDPSANIDDAGSIEVGSGEEFWLLVQPYCEVNQSGNGVWGFSFDGDGEVSGPQTIKYKNFWSGNWAAGDLVMNNRPPEDGCGNRLADFSGPHRFEQPGTWYFSPVSGWDGQDTWISLYVDEFDPDQPEQNLVGSTGSGPIEGIEADRDYFIVVQPFCGGNTGPWFFIMWPPEPFRLNQAVAGTYYNRDTSGQGNLVDIDPVTRFVFMAWFTWASGPEAGAISPDAIGDTNHRWLTASGTHGYRDTFVEMDVYNSTGGAFNDPKAVTTAKTGTAVLEMDGCDSGELRYTLDSGEEGVIPMVRLLTGRVAECEEEYEGPDVLYKR